MFIAVNILQLLIYLQKNKNQEIYVFFTSKNFLDFYKSINIFYFIIEPIHMKLK